MSVKINKNGNEYPIGVIPQSLYDDVEDLKDAVDDIDTDINGVETLTFTPNAQQTNFNVPSMTVKKVGNMIYALGNVKVVSNPSSWTKVGTISIPTGYKIPINIQQDFKGTDFTSGYALGVMVSENGSSIYMFWRGGSTGDSAITIQIQIPLIRTT